MRVGTVKQRVILNINIRRFTAALLQDNKMTHDCDQSQRIFLQKILLTCWLTLSLYFYSSLLSILLFTFFNRDLNYIHYYSA